VRILRAESAQFRESVGAPRHDRVRVLGISRGVQRSLAVGVSQDAFFFWARVTWVAIAFVPATLFHLALTYPRQKPPGFNGGGLSRSFTSLPSLGTYLISMTGLIINGMSSNAFGPSARVAPTSCTSPPYFSFGCSLP